MADGEELGLIDGTGDEDIALDDSGLEPGDDGAGDSDDALGGGQDDAQGDDRGDRQDSKESDRGDAARDRGRATSPVQVRQAIKQLLASDQEFAKKFPRLEKEVTGALYAKAQLDKLGGVQKFNELSESIEAHGGLEGVQALAEEVEASRQLEAGFEKGDPAIVEGWSKDYPDGFRKLIGPALDTLEKLDGEKFDQLVSAQIVKTFDRVGAYHVLDALGQALSSGKTEDAVKEFNKLTGFLASVKRLSEKAKAAPYSDRERQLDERETSIAEKDRKTFFGNVRTDVNVSITTETNRLLRQAIKVRKVEPGMANRLRKEINARLQESVNTNAAYQRNYKAVMAAKDQQRATNFIVSNAKAKLQKVIAAVLGYPEYKHLTQGGNGADSRTVRRPAGSAGVRREGREGGDSTVSGRPKTSDVDFTKTDKARFLASIGGHGEAWLRSGKKAKW